MTYAFHFIHNENICHHFTYSITELYKRDKRTSLYAFTFIRLHVYLAYIFTDTQLWYTNSCMSSLTHTFPSVIVDTHRPILGLISTLPCEPAYILDIWEYLCSHLDCIIKCAICTWAHILLYEA
uniref:Uncharacterized protein n=1 Tax=Arundo donax TaxID=35708 RepID=A0A0A9EBJ5_ARUDO